MVGTVGAGVGVGAGGHGVLAKRDENGEFTLGRPGQLVTARLVISRITTEDCWQCLPDVPVTPLASSVGVSRGRHKAAKAVPEFSKTWRQIRGDIHVWAYFLDPFMF